MRTWLDPAQIASYRDSGFLVLPQLLDADELAVWRDAFDAAVSSRANRVPGTDVAVPAGDPERQAAYDRVFTQRLFLSRTDQRMRELVLDQRLGLMAAQLEGVDEVRIWQDQALVKEPYGDPTGLHLDGPIFPFESPHCITVWIALDDATAHNGALCYLPGTHKEHSRTVGSISGGLGALFDSHPRWKAIEPVFCPVPAGAAVLHNGYTAHGAGANLTPGRRRAMTIVYMGPDATMDHPEFAGRFSWTDEELERYAVGDRLDDPRQFPLAYSGATK